MSFIYILNEIFVQNKLRYKMLLSVKGRLNFIEEIVFGLCPSCMVF